MTLNELIALLKECPLVASVQASEGSPLEDPHTLARMALASAQQGVRVLRAQGVESIKAIKKATGLPVIGLIKRKYPDSEVHITPTMREVEELIETGCEAIALDATERNRPAGTTLNDLVRRIHDSGRLVYADCDNVASVRHADENDCDIIGTTLAGYTADSPPRPFPALEFVYRAVEATSRPVLAEGRITNPRQAHTVLRCGAVGFVVGGALNDPVKQTQVFLEPFRRPSGPVGAIDIGGTWIRFGVFSEDWKLLESKKVELQHDPSARSAWIEEQIARHRVSRVGVSSGGTIDPNSKTVIQAKSIIPGHLGFSFRDLGAPTIALNDGLAAAWGHACLPQFAGMKGATLSLGTGVGCGLVDQGRLVMGAQGQTLKLNDLEIEHGSTLEDSLGGASLTENPSSESKRTAQRAFGNAVKALQALCMPDVIVVCGGVGLSGILSLTDALSELRGRFVRESDDPQAERSWVWPEIVESPFGREAGLYGAAALALYPPVDLAHLLES